MTQQKQLVETKIYTINDTEFYQLLPQEALAIDTLVKTKTPYSEYTGLVPNEVEKIAELAKPVMWELYIGEVEITPDPFLIGVIPTGGVYFSNVPTGLKKKYSNYTSFPLSEANELIEDGKVEKKQLSMSSYDGAIRYYLLAQWGRELKELSELVKVAKQKFLSSKRREYTEMKLEAEKNLAMLELEAEEKFGVIY